MKNLIFHGQLKVMATIKENEGFFIPLLYLELLNAFGIQIIRAHILRALNNQGPYI